LQRSAPDRVRPLLKALIGFVLSLSVLAFVWGLIWTVLRY
jgi:hypothetical protein